MESESQDTSRFKIGQWVICLATGPLFGRSGEIVEPANGHAKENGIDWWVLFTQTDGAGLMESQMMLDPRFREPVELKPIETIC